MLQLRRRALFGSGIGAIAFTLGLDHFWTSSVLPRSMRDVESVLNPVCGPFPLDERGLRAWRIGDDVSGASFLSGDAQGRLLANRRARLRRVGQHAGRHAIRRNRTVPKRWKTWLRHGLQAEPRWTRNPIAYVHGVA